jgi:hypothetical protein
MTWKTPIAGILRITNNDLKASQREAQEIKIDGHITHHNLPKML